MFWKGASPAPWYLEISKKNKKISRRTLGREREGERKKRARQGNTERTTTERGRASYSILASGTKQRELGHPFRQHESAAAAAAPHPAPDHKSKGSRQQCFSYMNMMTPHAHMSTM